MKKQKSYGKFTIGYGTTDQKELDVIESVICSFIDNRKISISKIENGTYLLNVRNGESTERRPDVNMWLSKESLMGLLSTIITYIRIKGIDVQKELDKINQDKTPINCTPNLFKKLNKLFNEN